ncbi:small acid-soluble spore protein Tlp [Salipaludibacillus daqingensis]|uniref:small acid-soluble spore protein Tlp n=1 Tax=Salipaludibacillus daqingensis TaxID=3041001 RepID=UPI00247428E7|nr:small acid-soluble spore protein Tlp [Salipaludibacillus daqingensis]
MAKKDKRSNNVERLQTMVANTEENIAEAKLTLDDDGLADAEKQAIRQKNDRREESIEAFKNEIADEKGDRENGRY